MQTSLFPKAHTGSVSAVASEDGNHTPPATGVLCLPHASCDYGCILETFPPETSSIKKLQQ
jgi:hypothetical protein